MSTLVVVEPPPGRTLSFTEFASITTAVLLNVTASVDGGLVLEFDAVLTQAQIDAITNRANTINANAETLRTRAIAALQNNRNYLALTTKTQADVVNQVDALTRQVNGLIREACGLYDGTD